MASRRQGRHGYGDQYWAFLANPRVYRIEDALLNLDQGTWTTKGKNVAAGDRVLIWKAKGADADRGVVALGEVLTDPIPMPSGGGGGVLHQSGRRPNNRGPGGGPLRPRAEPSALARRPIRSCAARSERQPRRWGHDLPCDAGAMGVRRGRGRWVAARWGCASSSASLASMKEPSRASS